MSTIYDPDARTIRKSSTGIFLATLILGAIGPMVFSGGWAIHGIVSLASFIYMLYLRYCCERYTFLTTSYFTFAIFIFSFVTGCMGYLIAVHDLGWPKAPGAFLALALMNITPIVYLTIYLTPPKKFPFEVEGEKVSSIAPDTSHISPWFIGGSGAALSSVAYTFMEPLMVGTIALLIFLVACICILIHARHRIRGLRTLRAKEKELSISYTFRQIEEIREFRNRAWLVRFARWGASRMKSSSR